MSIVSPAALAQVFLFAELSPEELEDLVTCLRRRRYARGEVIFRQGDPGLSLYIIETGSVRIVLTSPDGKELVLAVLGPRDFFGELALLDGEPRSADAVAKDTCQILLLHRDDFLRFLEVRPRVAIRLLAVLSRRLRRSDQLAQDAAFLDVPARLARAILELAATDGQTSGEGLIITSRLTQAELAGMVGATRESVNKWLGYYERQGLIRRQRGFITVLRPDALQKRIY